MSQQPKPLQAFFVPEPFPDEAIDRALDALRGADLFRYERKNAQDSLVAVLEEKFASFLGRRYALAVNSCGSALQLALLAAGVKPAEQVLVPAFTFTAVTSAIINVGAQPVLVDIRGNYCIDPEDLIRKISRNTRFLLLSYMRGHAADLDRILEICANHGIVVIEDCAHSLGTTWNGKPTGAFGLAACFSFHDKLINSGEGGLIVTDDDEFLMRATVMSGCYESLWRTHRSRPSQANEYQTKLPQFSMRMHNVTAALILEQLKNVEAYVARYSHIKNLICEELEKSPRIELIETDSRTRHVSDTFQFRLQEADTDRRRTYLESIQRQGIPLASFDVDSGNERCYWNWKYLQQPGGTQLPNTQAILQASFDLRLRRTMPDEVARHIGAILRASA